MTATATFVQQAALTPQSALQHSSSIESPLRNLF